MAAFQGFDSGWRTIEVFPYFANWHRFGLPDQKL
jgi:hypothetical protein